METWIIKINDESSSFKKRIKVEYIPLLNSVKLTGQIEIKNLWEDLTVHQIGADIEPDVLNKKIIFINLEINAKIDKYLDLKNSFELLKQIEIE